MNCIDMLTNDLWNHIVKDNLTLGVPFLRLTNKMFATMLTHMLMFQGKVAFSYHSAAMTYADNEIHDGEDNLETLASTIVRCRMFDVYREIALCKGRIHLHIAREWERCCAKRITTAKDEYFLLDYVTNVLTLPDVNLGKIIHIRHTRYIPLKDAVARGWVALVSLLLTDDNVYENVNILNYVHSLNQVGATVRYNTAFGDAKFLFYVMQTQDYLEDAKKYSDIIHLLKSVPDVVEYVEMDL